MTKRMTLQELAYDAEARAAQQKQRAETFRQKYESVASQLARRDEKVVKLELKVRELERALKRMNRPPRISELQGYWLERYSPVEIQSLACGLAETDL